jgi:uncharacterized cupredoxin-like copper-binding protein
VADHHRLDEAMTAVATSLAGEGDARTATAELAEVLEAHLDREEAAAIPAFLACLSAAEYDALHEEATKRGGMRSLAWVMPWLLDHASEEEAAEGSAAMPAPIRWMNARVWTPRYRRLAAPLRGARRRRVGSVATAAALLLALVAGVLSGCGGSDAGAASGPVTVVAQPPSSDVTITATDYTFEASSERIAAGRVRLTLNNKGTEAHQVQLGRVEPGTTVDSFVHEYHHHGAATAEKLLEWQTGVNGVEPGRSATVVGDVEPGHYLMVCFVPGHDGVSHIDKRMVVPIEVVDGGEPVAKPAPEGEVVIEDYAIAMPKGFDGNGTFAVRNAGPADHELILMRFKDGKDLNDLIAWSDAGSKGDAPVTYEGGVGTIPAGETSFIDWHLQPGRYFALCMLTGPTGQAHALMGMTASFELT